MVIFHFWVWNSCKEHKKTLNHERMGGKWKFSSVFLWQRRSRRNEKEGVSLCSLILTNWKALSTGNCFTLINERLSKTPHHPLSRSTRPLVWLNQIWTVSTHPSVLSHHTCDVTWRWSVSSMTFQKTDMPRTSLCVLASHHFIHSQCHTLIWLVTTS